MTSTLQIFCRANLIFSDPSRPTMMNEGDDSTGRNDEGELPSDTTHVSPKFATAMEKPTTLSREQDETKNDSKPTQLPHSQEPSTSLDDVKPSAVATATTTMAASKNATGSSPTPRKGPSLKDDDDDDDLKKEVAGGDNEDDSVATETDSKRDNSSNSNTSPKIPSGTGTTTDSRIKVTKKAKPKTLTQTLTLTKKMSMSGSSIKPEETDVLCGRGRPFQSWPGNLRLHRVVNRHKAQYLKSRRYDKLAIAELVVHEIKTGDDGLKPGRFLRRKVGCPDESWEIAPDSVAREKASHALRGRPKHPPDVTSVPPVPASSTSMQFPFGTMAPPTSGLMAGLGGGARIPQREALSAGVSFGSVLSNPTSGSGSDSIGSSSISFPQSQRNSIASTTESSTESQSGVNHRPMSEILREYQLQHLYKEQQQTLADRLIRLQQLRSTIQSGDLGQGLSAPTALQQEQLRQDQQRFLLLQRQQALLRIQQSGAPGALLDGNISNAAAGSLLGIGQSSGLPSSMFSTTPQSLQAISTQPQNLYPDHSLQQAAGLSQSMTAHDQLSRALALQGALGSGIPGGSRLDDQMNSMSTTSAAGLSNQSLIPAAALHSINQLPSPNQNLSMMLNDNAAVTTMGPNRPLTLEMLLGNHSGQGTALQSADNIDDNQGRPAEEELRRHLSSNKKH